MANEPKVNLAFVETLPNNPVRGTVYMSPDSAEGFLKVGVGDNETETIFDSSVYAKKSDSVWVRGEGANSAVLKDTSSSATGAGTVAHGDNVHATGDYSHAEGFYIYASGIYSHAEGGGATASGMGSHAEGGGAIAFGECSHAEGYGTTESLSFTISGDANATTYTTNVAHSLKVFNVLEYNGITAVVTAIDTNAFTVDHTLSDVQLTNASGLKKIIGISYNYYSHVEGSSATALGECSHAEGNRTTASGNYSHAEGRETTASGDWSHAEGRETTASGNHSHAEGFSTRASEMYSHAEGRSTIASGYASHAEGHNTIASNYYSHAEGINTIASGINSHAEGSNTRASGQASHAEGYQTDASGNYSHAEGYDTTAFGEYSHAEGYDTSAFGDYSHAEGYGSITSLAFTISGAANATDYTTNAIHGLKVGNILEYNGIIAKVTVIKNNNKFTVDHTLSNVQLTDASGIKRIQGISYDTYSHVEGNNTTASSSSSHAEGYTTIASGQGSHAEGYSTIASGNYSHAEGTGKASGNYSHAEGYSTIASGNYSHAEGYSTKASADYSHAEGNITKANGQYSHAEGWLTKATGQYSHAEGKDSSASGVCSHAEGNSTTATNNYEHAQGSMNISHTNTIFSIGNGYHDGASDQDIRSNALEIMRNGDAYLYGVASFDGQTISNNKTLQYFLNIDSISNYEYDIIFDNVEIPADFDTTRLHLYIDDYPSDMISDMMEEVGAETIEEFYNIVYDANVNDNSQYAGNGNAVYANEYIYEDMVEIDGTTYYLWGCPDCDMYAIMSMDMTMDYLDSIAKYNNPNSNVSPFVAIVTEDLTVRYDDTTDKNINDGYQLACYKIDEE